MIGIYDITETRTKKKKEKILYCLERQIRNHYLDRGYWKHSIAMQLSYELGSLKSAWSTLKQCISNIEYQRRLKRLQDNSDTSDSFMEWVKETDSFQGADLSKHYGISGQYTGD